MASKAPNTICKNVNCHNGDDGGRKHYYSCRYCAYTANWRSVACCEECYDAYMAQVSEARARGRTVDLLPERTDMDQDEVYNLIHNADIEAVVKQTKDELEAELTEHPEWGYAKIVDDINTQLDAEKQGKNAK